MILMIIRQKHWEGQLYAPLTSLHQIDFFILKKDPPHKTPAQLF